MKRPVEQILFLSALLVGCADDPLPKPRGYFRIDLPEQRFTTRTDSMPFTAEIAEYAKVVERRTQDAARWFDLRYPKQRATVHLTWSPVNGELQNLITDAHKFKSTHQAKAAKIKSERTLNDSTRVFGNTFDVEGDVASPFVFYLTDSTNNFLYGALYFDAPPNADSLAPVTERIRSDMRHMITTLRWR